MYETMNLSLANYVRSSYESDYSDNLRSANQILINIRNELSARNNDIRRHFIFISPSYCVHRVLSSKPWSEDGLKQTHN